MYVDLDYSEDRSIDVAMGAVGASAAPPARGGGGLNTKQICSV